MGRCGTSSELNVVAVTPMMNDRIAMWAMDTGSRAEVTLQAVRPDVRCQTESHLDSHMDYRKLC